ncbi:unnamed protein product, partial [Vitis vinifera]|uniref:Uncharacterized protein n=1 Tax=Vitis vinifera TaxID=29760 RepID=D7SLT4_VITVI
MFTAVSVLSPVRTHNFLPACASLLMHSRTPFRSLSSTIVAARRIKSFSILSATSSIISSQSVLAKFFLGLKIYPLTPKTGCIF